MKMMAAQIENLKTKLVRYKVRLCRSKKRNAQLMMSSTSPRTTLKKELSRDKTNISQTVRRQLLFGSALKADVGASL
jgi:hypothetical protein